MITFKKIPSPRKLAPTQLSLDRGKASGAIRLTIPKLPTITALSVPAGMNFLFLRNQGNQPLLFNFDAQPADQFITIAAGLAHPQPVSVSNFTKVNLWVVQNDTIMEGYFWR